MKQDLYEELNKRKNEGEILNWNLITKKESEELFRNHSDNTIAELYGVTAYQVKKQRNKWNIKQYNYAIQESLREFLSENKNKTLFENLNKNSKERLLSDRSKDILPIALTHYLFRNGPVEDMHADGKLSQNDMKILNKFMVNRIAGLLEAIDKGEWLKLELLFNFYSLFGKDWDKPVPDTDEIDALFSNKF